ncbi:MAG: DUF5305 family protein, partial [Thermoplasmata archaeon]
VWTSRPINITLGEIATESIATDSWSKLVSTTVNSTSVLGSRFASLPLHYLLNLSQILDYASELNNETGSTPGPVFVSFVPSVSLVLSGGGLPTEYLGFTPELNLTILGGTITPSAMSSVLAGAVTRTGPPASSLSTVAGWGPLAAFAISLGGLVIAGLWLFRLLRRRPASSIEEIVRPYSDAIAESETPPVGRDRVLMKSWADVVTVADTLGKPILRWNGTKGSTSGPTFFVRDGTALYLYSHDGSAPPPPAGAPLGVGTDLLSATDLADPGALRQIGRWLELEVEERGRSGALPPAEADRFRLLIARSMARLASQDVPGARAGIAEVLAELRS